MLDHLTELPKEKSLATIFFAGIYIGQEKTTARLMLGESLRRALPTGFTFI
jgi:hypothetical protein